MDSQRNVVLTGFMGVGKTTIGALVAQRLARSFIDMDAEIEARAKKTISDIFFQDGEAAFRDLERVLCLELADQDGLVIATGGGALGDPQNREVMARKGTIICLTCGVSELARRIESGHGRPLLSSEFPRHEIQALLEERAGTYSSLPWHVDTTEASLDEIVTDVLNLASLRQLEVRGPVASYPIHIGSGLLQHLGDAVRASGVPAGSKTVVVSNDIVSPLYGDVAVSSLAASGYDAGTCIIPDGEHHKTLETVRMVYESLVQQGLDRSSAIICLGGGVTGDIGGFAAATYLRGIRFVQVPTTLLAMVDASVGGKTGVDLPAGKNLVGAFKQPDLVLIDPSVLSTLANEEIRCGLAETIKHGILGDPSLFANLASGPVNRETWTGEATLDLIVRALQVKIAVVEEDPIELGKRALLNLGHTVGHAVETTSGFTIRHGDAVAIGLVAAARLAVALNEADAGLVGVIESTLSRWDLPIRVPNVEVGRMFDAMHQDKKRTAAGLRWILPRAIGEATIVDGVPEDAVRGVLIEMGARSES